MNKPSFYSALTLSLLLGLFMLATPARANKAETMIIPTRVVIDKTQRFATLYIKNTGDAIGNYTVDVIDMIMGETGPVTELPADKPDEFSAKPIIRISPRSVTLKPLESQAVRILVRKPEGLADGEYRSHIKVRIVDDNVDQNPTITHSNEQMALGVKANLIMVVPLIVRSGDTSFTASLSEPRIVHNGNDTSLDIIVGREGTQSSAGSLIVLQKQGGAEIEVGKLAGATVYRSTTRRLMSVPLHDLKGNNNLTIRYVEPPEIGTAVLAETSLP